MQRGATARKQWRARRASQTKSNATKERDRVAAEFVPVAVAVDSDAPAKVNPSMSLIAEREGRIRRRNHACGYGDVGPVIVAKASVLSEGVPNEADE